MFIGRGLTVHPFKKPVYVPRPLLDEIPGATSAYGTTKLRANYNGPCLRVRTIGGVANDVGFDSNGNIDEATLNALHGGGTLYVITWYDQSGNGRDLTIPSFPSANPTRAGRIVVSGVIQKDIYGNVGLLYAGTQGATSELEYLQHPTCFPASSNTVVAHCQPVTNASIWFGHIYGATNHGLNWGANGQLDIMLYKDGGNSIGGQVTSWGGKPEGIIASTNLETSTNEIWQNGMGSNINSKIITPFVPDTLIYVGYERKSFRYRLNGILTQLVIYPKVFSRTECKIAWRNLKRTKSMPSPAFYLCDGDSLTQGSGSWRNYQQRLQEAITDTSKIRVFWNDGVGGFRVDNMDSFASSVSTAPNDGKGMDFIQYLEDVPERILIAWGGANDFFQGRTGTSAYNNLVTYFTNRKAAVPYNQMGVVCTPPCGTVANTNEAIVMNDLIRTAMGPGGALTNLGVTKLYDTWTLPEFDEHADTLNTTYYFDGTHFTIAGHNLIAGLIKTVEGLT